MTSTIGQPSLSASMTDRQLRALAEAMELAGSSDELRAVLTRAMVEAIADDTSEETASDRAELHSREYVRGFRDGHRVARGLESGGWHRATTDPRGSAP